MTISLAYPTRGMVSTEEYAEWLMIINQIWTNEQKAAWYFFSHWQTSCPLSPSKAMVLLRSLSFSFLLCFRKPFFWWHTKHISAGKQLTAMESADHFYPLYVEWNELGSVWENGKMEWNKKQIQSIDTIRRNAQPFCSGAEAVIFH